jgi:hypothetical protein
MTLGRQLETESADDRTDRNGILLRSPEKFSSPIWRNPNMRPIIFSLLVVSVAVAPIPGTAQEPVAKSKIVSVSVFKNGLALVQQEVQAPGDGTYRLDTAPNPVHGTFWIKSNCQVEAALKMVDFETPRPLGGLQDELAGKEVIVHSKDKANQAGLEGVVEQSARNPSGFLVLKTAAGSHYINPSEIASIEVKGAGKGKEGTVKQQRPELVLTVAKSDKKPLITVSYLTHGFSWAPSYLVEIADGKNLSIEMAAVVRNEFANLKDAEFKLMAGLPSIEFANVVSPLAPRQNIEKFLSGLRSDAALIGDGTDAQFTSIGKRSLKEGESLSLSVGRAKVAYERVIEWNVASDESGSIAEETWDVLHFKNPFTFPMGTAPAMVMDKDQFKSQRTCSSAMVGEGSSLRFTRSRDTRTRGQEREDQPKKPAEKDAKDGKDGKLDLIRIGVNEYRRATIHGEMTVTNQRQTATKIILHRALKGKVLGTEGDPKVLSQEEGLRSVNPSQEVVWTVSLAPGEEKTVRYRYQALILQSRERWNASW